MILDATLCTEHGWLSHAAIHEAAHAVFAYARGIPFVEVSITNPADLGQVLTGAPTMAGGMVLAVADPMSWVPQQAGDALDVYLAGACAEKAAFGHTLPQSSNGDLRFWLHGMGWDSPEHLAESREAIARSTARLQEEIPQRYAAIKRVALGLTRDLNTDQNGLYTNFDEPIALSADEIIAFIADD